MRIKNVLIPFLLSLTVTFVLVFLAYQFSERPAVKPYEKPSSPLEEAGNTQPKVPGSLPTEAAPDTSAETSSGASTAPAPTTTAPSRQPAASETQGHEQPMTDEQAERLIARAAMNDRKLVQTLAAEVHEETSPVLEALVRDGRMSPEDVRKLKKWSAARKAAGATQPRTAMAGSTVQGETPVRRYRLTDEGSFVTIEMKRRQDGSWEVADVAIPLAEGATIAPEDPFALADAFIQRVLKGDVATARSLVADGRVDAATLAGLCMIFDENRYTLRFHEPIRTMFQNEKNAGFLVYLRSRSDDKTAHIGLEMVRGAGGWKISAVSLDSVLEEYERSGGLEGGRYFPIVRNPRGGESLALFFGYNDDALTPRSLRQLAIVAELMKGTERRLDISGHTDDIGSQRFNYALSMRRAEAVRRALVRDGVDASRISVHGFGKTQPLRRVGTGAAPEQVEEVRGENRRAEILLDFTE